MATKRDTSGDVPTWLDTQLGGLLPPSDRKNAWPKHKMSRLKPPLKQEVTLNRSWLRRRSYLAESQLGKGGQEEGDRENSERETHKHANQQRVVQTCRAFSAGPNILKFFVNKNRSVIFYETGCEWKKEINKRTLQEVLYELVSSRKTPVNKGYKDLLIRSQMPHFSRCSIAF